MERMGLISIRLSRIRIPNSVDGFTNDVMTISIGNRRDFRDIIEYCQFRMLSGPVVLAQQLPIIKNTLTYEQDLVDLINVCEQRQCTQPGVSLASTCILPSLQ